MSLGISGQSNAALEESSRGEAVRSLWVGWRFLRSGWRMPQASRREAQCCCETECEQGGDQVKEVSVVVSISKSTEAVERSSCYDGDLQLHTIPSPLERLPSAASSIIAGPTNRRRIALFLTSTCSLPVLLPLPPACQHMHSDTHEHRRVVAEMDVGPDQDPYSGRSSGRSTAPVHSVPQASIVSIEHPCIVSNFDNGFKSLGGEPQLRHVRLSASMPARRTS